MYQIDCCVCAYSTIWIWRRRKARSKVRFTAQRSTCLSTVLLAACRRGKPAGPSLCHRPPQRAERLPAVPLQVRSTHALDVLSGPRCRWLHGSRARVCRPQHPVVKKYTARLTAAISKLSGRTVTLDQVHLDLSLLIRPRIISPFSQGFWCCCASCETGAGQPTAGELAVLGARQRNAPHRRHVRFCLVACLRADSLFSLLCSMASWRQSTASCCRIWRSGCKSGTLPMKARWFQPLAIIPRAGLIRL